MEKDVLNEHNHKVKNKNADEVNAKEADLRSFRIKQISLEDDKEAKNIKNADKLPIGKKRKKTVKQAKKEQKKLTEKEKIRLKKRKKQMHILSLLIALVIFITVLLLTYFLLIVDEIEISGVNRFTQAEILDTSLLKTGKHIWVEKIGEAKRLIEADPYIAEAKITRVYPNKIKIEITEREEAAVIIGANTNAVIDYSGYVLSIGARHDYTGLLKVYGVGSRGYQVNQRLGEETSFTSRTLVTLLTAIFDAGLNDTIETIDLSNSLSITMTIFDGMEIHFGQIDNVNEKLENFKIVLPTLKKNGLSKNGTLDLSAKGDPVYTPESADNSPDVSPDNIIAPGNTNDPVNTNNPDITNNPNATAQPNSGEPQS